jgi:hypothetical protein
MSPLLLRATTATASRVISPGAVATKGHNSDLSISPTSLIESGTGLYKYLLTSSAESSPHQPMYRSFAGWFHITIEPDANRGYSWLVRSVSSQLVF